MARRSRVFGIMSEHVSPGLISVSSVVFFSGVLLDVFGGFGVGVF